MNKLAWSFGFAVVGGLVVAAGGSGCSVTVNGDDGGTDDASTTPDTSTGMDAAAEAEAATGTDAPAQVEASTPGDGGDGGVCPTQINSMVSAACDQCIDTSCCTPLDTCTTDSPLDDAGVQAGCLGYGQCVLDWANMDGGDVMSGQMVCTASGLYTMNQESEGNALLVCIATNCASQCQ